MEALLEIDAEQSQGAIAAFTGDVPHRVVRFRTLQPLPSPVKSLHLDPLGGRATHTLGEGILQCPAGVMAPRFQVGEGERLTQILPDVVDQLIEGITAMLLPLQEPIHGLVLTHLRQQHGHHQPIDLVFELQPIKQTPAIPRQLPSHGNGLP